MNTPDTSPQSPGPKAPSRARALSILCLIAVALFTIRLTGLPNLMDNEYRVGACVLNAIQGGNWICPHDSLGNTDKPPMLTWLSALVTLPFGQVNRFTLYLPTALATLLTTILIYSAGGRHFGQLAGFLGALGYLLSDVGGHQMGTARWDGLFALTVTLTALAGFRAWSAGQGWTAFWVAAAAAMLTKGPLGLLLAGFGFGAVAWERRSGHPFPIRGSHSVGVHAFLLISVGWFALAYRQVGPHLIDNMLRSEFVGHMVVHEPAHRFWKPIIDFVGNFAPWSLATAIGLWRIVRYPAAADDERRFERFCFLWFVCGLLVFSISPHNPSRLMYPLIPAAAMIAGRELARFAARLPSRAFQWTCLGATVAGLAVLTVQYRHLERKRPQVQETIAIQELTQTIADTVGRDFPFAFVLDTPFAMQLSLNVMRPTITFSEAAQLLRGNDQAFVVVSDLSRLRRVIGDDAVPLHEIARATAGLPFLHIVANRDRLAVLDPIATAFGPLRLHMQRVRIVSIQDDELVLTRVAGDARATLTNTSGEPANIILRLDPGVRTARRLAAGESWEIAVP